MPVISAAIIVRNESVRLRDCLNSIEGVADDIVVVDTGSTDDTAAIAWSFTSRVFHFRWGEDFAAARNHALGQTRGEFVLSIDADECLDNPAEARRLLDAFIERHDADTVGTVEIVNFTGAGLDAQEVVDHTERFFRRDRCRFEGAIHEQIVMEGGGKKSAPTGVRLRHYGYAQEPGAPDHKARRNIPILERELAAHPDDEYFAYQLGKAFFSLQEYASAIGALDTALQHIRFASGETPRGRLGDVSRKVLTDLVATLAYAYVNVGRTQEAAAHIERHAALGHAGCRRADFPHAQGYVYLMLGDVARSRAAYLASLHFGPTAEDVRGSGSFSSAYHLGLLCEAEKDLGAALGWLLQALRFKPDYAPALKRCADLVTEYRVVLPREIWDTADQAAFTRIYCDRLLNHVEQGRSAEASLIIEVARTLSPALLADCRKMLAANGRE
jgi:tetratricopeptide (TPR) repeat protein